MIVLVSLVKRGSTTNDGVEDTDEVERRTLVELVPKESLIEDP